MRSANDGPCSEKRIVLERLRDHLSIEAKLDLAHPELDFADKVSLLQADIPALVQLVMQADAWDAGLKYMSKRKSKHRSKHAVSNS